MNRKLLIAAVVFAAIIACGTKDKEEPIDYRLQLDVVARHWDGVFNWTQARVAAIPGMGENGGPRLIMTMQKWFVAHSDYYSGLYTMRSDDLGTTWTGPTEQPALGWRHGKGDVIIGICDFTPGWHEPSKKLLALGHTV